MRFTKENSNGELLFWIDVELAKIDLSEYSNEPDDYGEEWQYKCPEIPSELIEEVSGLGKMLNQEGGPVPEDKVEHYMERAMNAIVNSGKANHLFLN